MKLTATLIGSVSAIMDGGIQATEVAVTSGIKKATEGSVLEWVRLKWWEWTGQA